MERWWKIDGVGASASDVLSDDTHTEYSQRGFSHELHADHHPIGLERKTDNTELVHGQLEDEFDQMLVEMKSFLLRVPNKSDRQRCATWIQKFCEPTGPTVTAKNNRNMYARLLILMLKRGGTFERPFDEDPPRSGTLAALPQQTVNSLSSNLSSHPRPRIPPVNVPDWLAAELAPDLTGSERSAARENGAGDLKRRSTRRSSADVISSRVPQRRSYPSSTDEQPPHAAVLEDRERMFTPVPRYFRNQEPGDWNGAPPLFATNESTSTFGDDPSLSRAHNNEVEIRTKLIEARFQEESLRLQNKHDNDVKKILDRKNQEIEELQKDYRKKMADVEAVNAQLQKNVLSLQRDVSVVTQRGKEQLAELQRAMDERNIAIQDAYEKKLSQLSVRAEEDKRDLENRHTRSIEELMDETSARLAKMDDENRRQTDATSAVIKDLESRVYQLSVESDGVNKIRAQLERRKTELEGQVESLRTDLADYQSRCSVKEKENKRLQEEQEFELKSLRNRTEAMCESMRQEHAAALAKAVDTNSELGQYIAQLKQAMEKAENLKEVEMKKMEQLQATERERLEHLHEMKIKSIQQELSDIDQEANKRTKKLEQLIREKEAEIERLTARQIEQTNRNERIMQEFQSQVEKDSRKMYDEMNQQLEKTKSELSRMKQLREQQQSEFQRQRQQSEQLYEQQLAEMKMRAEQDRLTVLQDFHVQKDSWQAEREADQRTLREALQTELTKTEERWRERVEKDVKVIDRLEAECRDFRAEIIAQNEKHQQHIMQLGQLRDEEKRKSEREHESTMMRLRSQSEDRSRDLERRHASETEKLRESTGRQIQEMEHEFSVKNNKSNAVISDLQRAVAQLKDDLDRQRSDFEDRFLKSCATYEEEKRSYVTQLKELQCSLEEQRKSARYIERQLDQQTLEAEEKLTRTRAIYEEKLRGMMPIEIRQDLEETIECLRSQVNSLQQRSAILQEELDAYRRTRPLPSSSSSSYLPPPSTLQPPPLPQAPSAPIAASSGDASRSTHSSRRSSRSKLSS